MSKPRARKKDQWETAFGKFLEAKQLDRRQVAKELQITPSYVSMLARGTATPAFKLAQRIAVWSEGAFPLEAWQ